MGDRSARKPRDPSKRKPARARGLKKKDLDKVPAIEQAERLLSVDEKACALLSTEYDVEHAAATLCWTVDAVYEVLQRPAVRRFLQLADEFFLKELAKAKIRRMKKVGITRATIEQRLMDIAQMDPEETKGRVDGQVKALVVLAKISGLIDNKDADPLKNKTPEELKAFVMRAAAGMMQLSAPPPTIEARPVPQPAADVMEF